MSGSKCKGSYLFIWVSQEFSVIQMWKGFFLFWKFEENFSISWPWNKHECFLNLFPLYMRSTNCLVSCIGNADCLSIGVPGGLFHKLWWISKFCNIANVIYSDCCYCGQLYKMYTHSKLYIYVYIYIYTYWQLKESLSFVTWGT